jgi:AcrR family transcriptional regulator
MGRTSKITDEQILAAARQVFLAQGAGASTLDIAALAGISEASIFKRFGTKQALFLRAIGIAESPLWVNRLATHSPTQAIQFELLDLCKDMAVFYQDFMPRVMMLMTSGNLPQPPQFPPPPIRDSQLLATFLNRAIAQGYLRDCDALTVAYMMIGAIMQYAMARYWSTQQLPMSSKPTADPTEFAHSLMNIVWLGIAPAP